MPIKRLQEQRHYAKSTGASQPVYDWYGNHVGTLLRDKTFMTRRYDNRFIVRLVAAIVSDGHPVSRDNRWKRALALRDLRLLNRA